MTEQLYVPRQFELRNTLFKFHSFFTVIFDITVAVVLRRIDTNGSCLPLAVSLPMDNVLQS